MTPTAEETENERCWQLVIDNTSAIRRLIWIEYHRGWYAPGRVYHSIEDMNQMALMEAFNVAGNYDPTRGAAFTTYISRRMKGLVVDVLWPDRKKAVQPEFDVLDMLVDNEDGPAREFADPHDYIADAQAQLELDNFIDIVWEGLADRDRLILAGRVRGMTGRVIADRLGVSEGRISQLVKGRIADEVAAIMSWEQQHRDDLEAG
jgi:RNA polymerase sigma factor (sigma-70 family)